MENLTKWSNDFLNAIQKYGGYFNAHSHIDRANTLDREYLEHKGMDPLTASSVPLKVKQSLTGDLHTGKAYALDDLRRRMRDVLQQMHDTNTRKVISFIDTTADNVKLSALEIALELKQEFKSKLDFQVAAYQIFGFKDDIPERFEIFEEAVKMADIVGSLPERDDASGHIGYDEHIKLMFNIAQKYDKPLHVHVDQANNPEENGTETLMEATRLTLDKKYYSTEEPFVWAVHAISPSAYDDERFYRLVDGLLKYNI